MKINRRRLLRHSSQGMLAVAASSCGRSQSGVDQVNAKINAIVTLIYEAARERAAEQTFSGAIQGLPYLIKDLTNVAGVRTSSGSRAFQLEEAQPWADRRAVL